MIKKSCVVYLVFLIILRHDTFVQLFQLIVLRDGRHRRRLLRAGSFSRMLAQTILFCGHTRLFERVFYIPDSPLHATKEIHSFEFVDSLFPIARTKDDHVCPPPRDGC